MEIVKSVNLKNERGFMVLGKPNYSMIATIAELQRNCLSYVMMQIYKEDYDFDRNKWKNKKSSKIIKNLNNLISYNEVVVKKFGMLSDILHEERCKLREIHVVEDDEKDEE